jgi:hypothetical protein
MKQNLETTKKPICKYCKACNKIQILLKNQYVNTAKHVGEIYQLLEDQYVDIAKHVGKIQQLLQDLSVGLQGRLNDNAHKSIRI